MIQVWADRIEALPGRFVRARDLAAKAVEPEIQAVDLPRSMLRTVEDIEAWMNTVREQLKAALEKGPVVIR